MAKTQLVIDMLLNLDDKQLDRVANRAKTILSKIKPDIDFDPSKFKAEVGNLKQYMKGLNIDLNSKEAQTAIKQIQSQMVKFGQTVERVGDESGKKLNTGLVKGLDLKSVGSSVLGVFGGQAIMGGLQGIVGGAKEVLEAGKKSFEGAEYLKLGFKTAGLEGEALSSQLSSTGKFVSSLSDQFAVSGGKVREYAGFAALIGGSTGKANEDITTLAVGIEKASRGMIDGTMVVRTFSKGLNDPEAVAGLGRLKMQFPQLATALKDVTEPAEMTRVALQALNPMFNELKDQAKGPVGSMERLQNSMNAMKANLGRAFLESFAPALEGIGASLVPALQGVSKAIGSTVGFIRDNSTEIQVAAGIFGTFAAASWLANGGLVSLGANAANFGKTVISKLVPGLITQTAAAEGAAAGQMKLNLAILSNPYVIAAAAIAGLVVGLHYLSDALVETAQEQLDEANAQDKLLNKQIEAKNKEIELANSKTNLVQQFKDSGEAAMNNADLMVKLAEAYPGVIDGAKSYTDNLAALVAASEKTRGELSSLNGDLTKLQDAKIDLKINIANLQVDVAKKKIEDELTSAFMDNQFVSRGIDALFGASIPRDAAESIVKPYTDAIYNASNSADLQKAGIKFQTAIFSSKEFQGLSGEEKQAMVQKVQGMIDARDNALKMAKQDALPWFESLKADGMKIDDIYSTLARRFGVSKDAIKKIVEEQQKAKAKVDETKNSVESLATAFSTALSAAKKQQSDAVSGLAQAISDYNAALQSGDPKKITDAEANLAKTRSDSHKSFVEGKKSEKGLTAAELAAKKELGIKEEKAKADRKSQFEIESALFDKYKQSAKLKSDSVELDAEMALLMSGRKKTAFDELAAQQRRIAGLELEKKKFLETFKEIEKVNADGSLSFKPNIKAEDQTKLESDWATLQNSLKSDSNKELELKAKVKLDQIEIQKKIDDLNRAQLEFQIELGIKSPEDLIKSIESELSDVNSEIANKANQINVAFATGDTAALTALRSELIDLEKKRLDLQKEVNSKIKSLYDDELAKIKEFYDAKSKALEDSVERESAVAQKFSETFSKGTESALERQKSSDIAGIDDWAKKRNDEIQKMLDMEIISKEEADLRRASIDKQSEERKAAAVEKARRDALRSQALLDGAERERTRKAGLDKAKIEKEASEAQLKVLEDKKVYLDGLGLQMSEADQKQIDNLKATSQRLTGEIENNSSVAIEAFGIAADGMNEALTAFFAGDPKAATDALRASFSQIFGVLVQAISKEISAVAVKAVLDWLGYDPAAAALPFYIKLGLIPIMQGIITSGVNAIAQPAINGLLSFASGGRIDSPTMAILGDGAALGAPNREWIFNDPELKATINMAAEQSNTALLASVQALTSAVLSQHLVAELKNDHILIAVRRADYHSSKRSF